MVPSEWLLAFARPLGKVNSLGVMVFGVASQKRSNRLSTRWQTLLGRTRGYQTVVSIPLTTDLRNWVWLSTVFLLTHRLFLFKKTVYCSLHTYVQPFSKKSSIIYLYRMIQKSMKRYKWLFNTFVTFHSFWIALYTKKNSLRTTEVTPLNRCVTKTVFLENKRS